MADLEGVPWVPWNPSFEGLPSFSVADPDGFRGFEIPWNPFKENQKMYLRTVKAEKQAACLKCKSNLPTLTVRGLKA